MITVYLKPGCPYCANTLRIINERNISQLLLKHDQIVSKGYETRHIISGLANHIRELILCKNKKTY